jgi:hypothetical protein
VIENPVPGVAIALQRGATGEADLIGPVRAGSDILVFDFAVKLGGSGAAGGPRLLGPFVHGPQTARFVYLNAGAYAGQFGSTWRRRAKVPLGEIGWELIDGLASGGRLAAHIDGRARDGGPACASISLLPPGWRIG